MNCLSAFGGIPSILVDADYYNKLLFDQILKDKKITVDSFDKLYFITKNYSITSISDTKGNCSFIVEYKLNSSPTVTSSTDIKKKQLKISFAKNGLFGGEGWMIVDYD